MLGQLGINAVPPGPEMCVERGQDHRDPEHSGCLTLFLLTAELGHSRSSDSEELCSSLHTCHRKCRKEPPAEHTDRQVSAGTQELPGEHCLHTYFCPAPSSYSAWEEARLFEHGGPRLSADMLTSAL